MKFLLIGPDMPNKESIFSFSSNYAHNLKRCLQKYSDIEIVRHITIKEEKPKSESMSSFFRRVELNGAEHVMGLCIRHFSFFDKPTVKILKNRIPGAIGEFYDSHRENDPVDYCFSLSNIVDSPKAVYINWSADPSIFYPEKDPDEFRILIDHSHFSSKAIGIDRSDEIGMMCYELSEDKKLLETLNKKYNKTYKHVKIRRLVSGGIEDMDINKKVNNDYTHKSTGQLTLAEEYRKADLFIPTHKESLGMGALEASMSGAYIASPKGFIKKSRLDLLRHSVFTKKIDWNQIFSNLDIKKSVDMTKDYTWENSVHKIYKTFKKHGIKKN